MSVYFAQAGDYVKIGYSADPIARASTITRLGKRPADLPFGTDVDLIGWIPGDQWRETEMHGKFTSSRVAGEWFRLDRDEIRALILDDPRGVDMRRMSALAVFAAAAHPTMTRDEIALAGIPIEAAPLEALKSMDFLIGGAA